MRGGGDVLRFHRRLRRASNGGLSLFCDRLSVACRTESRSSFFACQISHW
jgi:hypothetical protein